ARDTVLGRLVALKTIRSGKWAEAEEVERFYREARAVAQLKHGHIVEMHDVNQAEDEHFLVMEYVGGGGLEERKAEDQADPRQAAGGKAAGLVEKLAQGVDFAHERGIVHRDLKPANVLLDEQSEPKVSDFGLAKFLDCDVELTRDGQALGTPAYMSPEQAAGQA